MGKIFKVESGIYGHVIIHIITTVTDICAIVTINIIAGIIAIGTIAIIIIITTVVA